MLDATPLLRLYTRGRQFSRRGRKYSAVQEEQLLSLIKKAGSTRFGRDHGFEAIRNVRDFQDAIPLRTYEQFWDDYWKPAFPELRDVTWPGLVPYYAVSSGTTSGSTKYIPLTREMLGSNHRAGLDLLGYHLSNRPHSRIFGGKSFLLGGSTELVDHGKGILSGDLSGITAQTIPGWAKSRYFPPPDLALLKDWDEKIGKLAERCRTEDIRMISGVPAWLLLLFDRMKKLRPGGGKRLTDFFPRLEMLVHGGVNFAPYHEQFAELIEGTGIDLREVYPASEGFIAVADRSYGEGLRLILDHGIFFEFVPLEELGSERPTRHWAANLETDVNYAVVMTTCAGLWSYVIGDTVRFVDLDPPRLLVTGRTSYYLSAFGEHLIEEEVVRAVTAGAHEIRENVVDYSVGAVFPRTTSELGGHLFVVEFAEGIPPAGDLARFSDTVDRVLCELNEDYAAHRSGGFGLKAPEIRAVGQGMFAAWMKKRGKLGGQNKVPRIISKTELFDDLVAFVS